MDSDKTYQKEKTSLFTMVYWGRGSSSKVKGDSPAHLTNLMHLFFPYTPYMEGRSDSLERSFPQNQIISVDRCGPPNNPPQLRKPFMMVNVSWRAHDDDWHITLNKLPKSGRSTTIFSHFLSPSNEEERRVYGDSIRQWEHGSEADSLEEMAEAISTQRI